MKVRKARKLLSKTDAVQILTDDEDVVGTYVNVDSVPNKYDDWKVKGIGALRPVSGEIIDDIEHKENFDSLTFPCLELYIGKK